MSVLYELMLNISAYILKSALQFQGSLNQFLPHTSCQKKKIDTNSYIMI